MPVAGLRARVLMLTRWGRTAAGVILPAWSVSEHGSRLVCGRKKRLFGCDLQTKSDADHTGH